MTVARGAVGHGARGWGLRVSQPRWALGVQWLMVSPSAAAPRLSTASRIDSRASR